VWTFLRQVENPWGHPNLDLQAMYMSATDDQECPLVVDNSTPSCGDSRFGCWTCTLVEQDKSMAAMVNNVAERKWMRPLLELRDKLDVAGEEEHKLRDFRKMNGSIQLFEDRIVHGPYTQEARETWLRDLLEAQTWVRANAPENVRGIELITMEELHEIRRLWVFDKHEVEDSLPRIYHEQTGEDFPGRPLDEHLALGSGEMDLLREACDGDDLLFTTARELLEVERRFRTMTRRSGLFEALEKTVRRGYFDDKDDAHAFALRKKKLRDEIADRLPLIEHEEDADAPA
jgi:DNA sulfur modification protein DndC